MEARTILDLYRRDSQARHAAHYVHHRPGQSRPFSTSAFFERTAALAGALEELGVDRGDRVALISENRPEWHMVDIAVLSLGAADVPLYPTLTPEQIAYQLRDSGARVIVAENDEQVAKVEQIRATCPDLRAVVQIEGAPPAGVLMFDDLADAQTGAAAGDRFWSRAAAVEPDDLATIVYTSGTTGAPKGVMLTHANFVANVSALTAIADVHDDDLVLECLPLCHVYERCAGYVYMSFGVPRAYCAVAHVGELMAVVRPTYFASVPRIFEKVYDGVHARIAQAPPARQAMFRWAVEVGRKAAQRRLAGVRLGPALALEHSVADALVLKKIRNALGGRLRATLSGAAPLPLFANEFFHAIGIWVQEGYGLTETSPVISANGPRPGENRLGTVGRALDNLEVRIADDGELLVRGPSVFSAYWNKPEQTAEVFDEEGFFHTGDVATIDADGFISITDRKKDLIVTAGGKNVAPQPIENRLRSSRYVDNAVLVGDRRPFIVALIVPNHDELERWATEHGLSGDAAALVASAAVRELYAGVVDEVNADLARYEQVKRFRLVAAPFSIEGGQLTPTLKIKRRTVEAEFRDVIEEMYAAGATS